jgi:hypothetical protein
VDSLSRGAAQDQMAEDLAMLVVERVIEHAATFDLIIVFNVEPDEFELGRISLFQEFVRANTGILPKPTKYMAHCIKVFCDLGPNWRERRSELLDLFRSEVYDGVRRGLDISYVQFAGEIFPPQTKKR